MKNNKKNTIEEEIDQMEDVPLMRKNYQSIKINLDDEYYEEPIFASVMRFLGCFVGYSCIPCFGGWCGNCCYPYKSINKGSRGVVQEFGRVKREIGDGMHYVNPLTETLRKVNMKVQVIDLQRQNVMTSDKLSINIDSVVYFQITNIDNALFRIDDFKHSIIELSYTTLRDVIGHSTLEMCLSERQQLAESIKLVVDEKVQNWGVNIIAIQIKDIIVPPNITSALSATVTAEREALAKMITAEADVKAAEMMRRAADILSTPAAMQIRSLEVIDRISQSPNTKIVILPSDLNLQSSIRANMVSNEIVTI